MDAASLPVARERDIRGVVDEPDRSEGPWVGRSACALKRRVGPRDPTLNAHHPAGLCLSDRLNLCKTMTGPTPDECPIRRVQVILLPTV